MMNIFVKMFKQEKTESLRMLRNTRGIYLLGGVNIIPTKGVK